MGVHWKRSEGLWKKQRCLLREPIACWGGVAWRNVSHISVMESFEDSASSFGKGWSSNFWGCKRVMG